MKIEARHVRRKQLVQYLDADFLRTERNQSETTINNMYAINKKRQSIDGLNTSSGPRTKRGRLSESVSCK